MSAGTNGGADDEMPAPYGTGPANQAADHPDPRHSSPQRQEQAQPPQVPAPNIRATMSASQEHGAFAAGPGPAQYAVPEHPGPVWYQPETENLPVTPGHPVHPLPPRRL